jgi:hypothetical protein
MNVVKITVLGLALFLTTSVEAMPASSLQTPDNMVTTIREGCGAGYQRVAGRCVRNTGVRHFRRAVRRCAAGLRLVDGRCIR